MMLLIWLIVWVCAGAPTEDALAWWLALGVCFLLSLGGD